MTDIEKPVLVVERLETYTQEDAEQLGLLRNALSSDRSSERLTPRRIDLFVEHDERALIAARLADSGRIVACETIAGTPVLEGRDEDPDMFGWLGFVSTLPESRNLGIGRKVAIAGMEWCRGRDIRELKFTSNSHNPERAIARATYLKYGAVIVSKGVGPKDTDLFNWNVELGLEKLTANVVADEISKAIAIVETDYLAPYENDDFILSKNMDADSPGLRQRFQEIYRQEAAALRALDPAVATLEDISRIRTDFEGQIKDLWEAEG